MEASRSEMMMRIPSRSKAVLMVGLAILAGVGTLSFPAPLRCERLMPVPGDVLESAAQGKDGSLLALIDWLKRAQNEPPDQVADVLAVLDAAVLKKNLDAARALADYQECRDRDKEVQYLTLLAEAGDRESMRRLGLYLLGGSGCAVFSPDQAGAMHWLGRAAELGDAAALDRLGDCNRDGYGVPVDLVKAKNLYQKAAAAGSKEAEGKINALNGASTVTMTIDVNFGGVGGTPIGVTRIAYVAISRPARALDVALDGGMVILSGEIQPLDPAGGDMFCLDPENYGQGVSSCKNAYVAHLEGTSLPVGSWVLRDANGSTLNAEFRPELEKALLGLYPNASVRNMAVVSARLGVGGTKSLVLWASSENGACLLKLSDEGRIVATQKVGDEYCLGNLHAFPAKPLGHDVVGFVTDHAGSAYYYHWIFWDWSGAVPREVLSENTAPGLPEFEDLDGDGTVEMLFENGYDRRPVIYQWDPASGRYAEANAKHPRYWDRRIQDGFAKLKAWRFTPGDRLPLIVVDTLAGDFRCRGGQKWVGEFLQLAKASLGPMIRYGRNDYLQGRARDLLKQVRQDFGPSQAGG